MHDAAVAVQTQSPGLAVNSIVRVLLQAYMTMVSGHWLDSGIVRVGFTILSYDRVCESSDGSSC